MSGASDLSDGVAVVGCGRMGCAMAGELARRGCRVTMYDHTDFTRSRAKQVLQATLREHVSNGLLLAHETHAIMGRVQARSHDLCSLRQSAARARLTPIPCSHDLCSLRHSAARASGLTLTLSETAVRRSPRLSRRPWRAPPSCSRRSSTTWR